MKIQPLQIKQKCHKYVRLLVWDQTLHKINFSLKNKVFYWFCNIKNNNGTPNAYATNHSFASKQIQMAPLLYTPTWGDQDHGATTWGEDHEKD